MFRRAVMIITGTATAVTGVLVYQPPKLSSVATSSKPIPDAPAPTQSNNSPSTKPSNKPTAKPSTTPLPSNPSSKTTPTPTPTSKTTLVSGVFAGNTIQTQFGPVQVEITVKDGVITSSKALQYPNGDRRSLSISQQAIPYLNEQTLGVVDASQVQGVSRATYTSNGWRHSLQSALSKAGL
ncbi:MAG: FMN-binding protein [Actinobacteria bacterium]|jgi:uncharacterized protein with FMN-binding domain|nr:FMN-binding protein [Actinomycetota bacterium]